MTPNSVSSEPGAGQSDKGSSRRLTMISCKPFQNASSTLTLERSTTDDFMARLPRRSGGNLRLHSRLYFGVGNLVPSRGRKTPKLVPPTPSLLLGGARGALLFRCWLPSRHFA